MKSVFPCILIALLPSLATCNCSAPPSPGASNTPTVILRGYHSKATPWPNVQAPATANPDLHE